LKGKTNKNGASDGAGGGWFMKDAVFYGVRWQSKGNRGGDTALASHGASMTSYASVSCRQKRRRAPFSPVQSVLLVAARSKRAAALHKTAPFMNQPCDADPKV